MRPVIDDNIPNFQVWPKKTFLGLDKSKAHCFTLPKILNDSVIKKFNLDQEYLQHNIIFVIDGVDYQAIARMVVMDRSKPNKHQKEEFPARVVVQFQWNAYTETCEEINYKLSDAYNSISAGNENNTQSVVFSHIRLNRFYLEFIDSNNPDYQVSISEI